MILTERIYTITEQGATERAGDVTLDIDEQFMDDEDAQRAVHINHGLKEGDFAVFLRFNPEGTSTGYLVSHVDKQTGGGIIVAGDAVVNSPKIWLSEELATNLERLTDEEWEDFHLTSLRNHLLRRRMRREAGR